MPKKDFTQVAFDVVQQATGEAPKKQLKPKVAARQQAGAKGGPARALKLTPERRREIAANAAQARWAKKSPTEVS